MLVGFYSYSCMNHSFLFTAKYCSVVLPQLAYTFPCQKTSLTAAVMNEAADTHTGSLRTHIFHIFQLLSGVSQQPLPSLPSATLGTSQKERHSAVAFLHEF